MTMCWRRLRLPDNAMHWVPYHRDRFSRVAMTSGEQGVAVVIADIARVDIQVHVATGDQ